MTQSVFTPEQETRIREIATEVVSQTLERRIRPLRPDEVRDIVIQQVFLEPRLVPSQSPSETPHAPSPAPELPAVAE